jgi:uncharacterized protein YecT (DUF1311 family)
MKATASAGILTLILSSFANIAIARAESSDPCGTKNSNMEMRECYGKEQVRVNAETDILANKIVAGLRKEAQDEGGVVADLLRKAADAVARSQTTWKSYRDQHCSAVEYSWTTGSCAGTAHESCMFELGQARLRELRSSFGPDPH